MNEAESRSYAENMRVARRMLERQENIKEIAQALYQYNARAMASANAILLPGDYMVRSGECMMSSRGAAVQISPEELADLVDGGALSKIFNPDDLNSADFGDKIDDIMSAIGYQAHYHDASCYVARDDLSKVVAVYDLPGAGEVPDMRAYVERSGDEYRLSDGVEAESGTMRQCSYEEFNPGGREIVLETQAAGPQETVNKSNAYDQLKETYLDGGENDVPEAGEITRPEDVAGYDKLSPSEKLALQRQYQEQMQAAQEAGAQAQSQWTPSLPRARGRMME